MKFRQSTSIALDKKGCTHNCHGCVSKFKHHKRSMEISNILKNPNFDNISYIDLKNRLEFSSRYSDTLIFTGDFAEPTKDMESIKRIMEINKSLRRPFVRFEAQTNGSLLLKKEEGNLDNNLIEFRKLGINTIALSLWDVFSSDKNEKYSKPLKSEWRTDIDAVCKGTKLAGHKLRICANLTDSFENYSIEKIFNRLIELSADEATLRVLYKDESANQQGAPKREKEIYDRITKNAASNELIKKVNEYILKHGEFQGMLPFEAAVYSIKHKKGYMSCVVDADCMSENINKGDDLNKKIEEYKKRDGEKYFVLYRDGLFGDWARKEKIT